MTYEWNGISYDPTSGQFSRDGELVTGYMTGGSKHSGEKACRHFGESARSA